MRSVISEQLSVNSNLKSVARNWLSVTETHWGKSLNICSSCSEFTLSRSPERSERSAKGALRGEYVFGRVQ